MKNKILIVMIMVVISFQSCTKEVNEKKVAEDEVNGTQGNGTQGNGTVVNISSYNLTESHHRGQNCMDCHKVGGSGEGWFTAAGTVYDSLKTSVFPNATVKLYTGVNGTGILKATIQVDLYGNFYTTENIDFGNGLYPLIEGNTTTKHMNSTISAGQCSSCHSVSTDRIWTK